MKVLLDRGASIDATNDEGWTALHKASIATSDNIQVIKGLLDRGARIDATNDKGRTALHEACAPRWYWDTGRDNTEAVKVLLERGTFTSTSIRIIDVADNSKLGDTALHYAARCTHPDADIIQLLLDNGANTNRKNADGETALDLARREGWERGVTLLTSTARIGKIADSAYGTTRWQ